MAVEATDANLIWAVWASPETAITGGKKLLLALVMSVDTLCTKMASTDEGDNGEADVDCLYTGTQNALGGYTNVKLFLQSSMTFVNLDLPSTGVNLAQKEVAVTAYAQPDDEDNMFSLYLLADVGAAWKNTTDEFFTHMTLSQGSYTKADVPAALDADDGEGEEVVEEKPV